MRQDKAKLIDEYARTGDLQQSGCRAGYPLKEAEQAFTRVWFQEAVAKRRKEIADAELINATKMLQEWYDVAFADIRDIVNIHVHCCRHCHGIDHFYQWTIHEYAEAVERALNNKKPAPDCLGGMDFNGRSQPHPECPECLGYGVKHVVFTDSRDLTPQAAKLFAGAKHGKHGIEILLRNQDAARDNLAKYLGMLVNKSELTGKDGKPLIPNSTQDLTEEQLLAIIAKDESKTE